VLLVNWRTGGMNVMQPDKVLGVPVVSACVG
jgi:hypothetical protein